MTFEEIPSLNCRDTDNINREKHSTLCILKANEHLYVQKSNCLMKFHSIDDRIQHENRKKKHSIAVPSVGQ